jgi:hypothetical protein
LFAISRARVGSDLSDLVGERSTQARSFVDGPPNVRFHDTSLMDFYHSTVGEITLTYTRLALPADPGLRVATYVAGPESKSSQGLGLLGTWASTSSEMQPS